MDWLVPENELGKEQREILKNVKNGRENVHIEGFPGSGKTILMLYAAKQIKDNQPMAKIIFVEFTHALIKMIEAALAKFPYKDIKVTTYYEFEKQVDKNDHFDYIFCDEVQDVPEKIIKIMKNQADRIVIAGDPNQSIYEKDPMWLLPPCEKEEINKILYPTTYPLTIIYRLTKFVISAVNSFFPDMNIQAGRPSMVKKHVKPRLWKASNQIEEVREIMKDAKETISVGDSVGILLPTHSKIQKFAKKVLEDAGAPEWKLTYDKYNNVEYDKLNAIFDANHIPMQFVANGYGDFTTNTQKITLITYHSSKGLDFDKVFLPFCNHVENFTTYEDYDKVLFMVAITRTRKDLTISYTGSLNHFVQSFQELCNCKDFSEDGTSIFDQGQDTIGTKEEDIFDW